MTWGKTRNVLLADSPLDACIKVFRREMPSMGDDGHSRAIPVFFIVSEIGYEELHKGDVIIRVDEIISVISEGTE